MTIAQQRASILLLCVLTLALCLAALWRWPGEHERRELAPPVLQPGDDSGEPPTPQERFEADGDWP